MRKGLIGPAFFVVCFLLFVVPVYALPPCVANPPSPIPAPAGFRYCPPGETCTALGCVPTKIDGPQGLVAWLLEKIIGLGGGLAFLLLLYGSFQILTSTGDPEKLATGKEIIVSAVSGLLMIIFSVLLLRIIGYDILRLPGFVP